MLVSLIVIGLLGPNVRASPKVLEDYERLLMKIKDKFKELRIASDPLMVDSELSQRNGRFSIPPINRLTTAHPIRLPMKPNVRKTANLFSPFVPLTTPASPLNYSVNNVVPTESKLRIQKLKNDDKVIVSSEGDEEGPFVQNPSMFDDLSTTTSIPIITTTAFMSPMFMLDTETAEEVNKTYTSKILDDVVDATDPTTLSTIVDNARFSYLETPIMDPFRRRRYHPRAPRFDSMEEYDDEDYIPQRRAFYRPSAYYDEYDVPRRQLGRRRHRYSKYRPVAAPIPLSLEDDSREFDGNHVRNKLRAFKSGTAGSKTFEPHEPLTLSSLLHASQSAGLADPKHGFIPSPKKDLAFKPPSSDLSKKSLQMSPENCRKVNSYAKIFGVTNPQKWVRHNCAFVQTFVKEPCKDINSFVDSCYQKRN